MVQKKTKVNFEPIFGKKTMDYKVDENVKFGVF